MLGTDEIQTRALLIHCNTKLNNLDITSHEVLPLPSSEGYTLGAGRAFTQYDKGQLVQILQDEEGDSIEYIPDTLLVKSRSTIVWYRKPAITKLRFQSVDGEATVNAALPGLIMIASASKPLRVFAFKGKGRPTADTPMYFTPLPNMYSSGSFCSGNVQVPSVIVTSNIPSWESFVLDTVNTHVGGVTTFKGCETMEQYIEQFKELESKGVKSFPAAKLVPVKSYEGQSTLDQVIRGQ